ncbi:hypothetical protein CGLO_10102 [Colletotrichum gloeosporioides Cg-14]|uniref:Uncharacterized protein n=1 Tax=Colletotrichum gloeosporioides (strain Cg-14) TaxID=1237896 RepID=T0LQI2_COLGC|nr:hypothetical protein CGLO_10102 [Colletotrichum gloeosporioides Cg-14]
MILAIVTIALMPILGFLFGTIMKKIEEWLIVKAGFG